jgi:hypothetical protein
MRPITLLPPQLYQPSTRSLDVKMANKNQQTVVYWERILTLEKELTDEKAWHEATQVRLAEAQKETADLQKVFDNTLNKIGRHEATASAAETKNRDLQRQINELNDKVKKQASEYSASNRENQLIDEKTRLKHEMHFLKVEMKGLKEKLILDGGVGGSSCNKCLELSCKVDRLTRQLQAEKSGNLGKCDFMRSDLDKGFADGDDEEPLPGGGSSHPSGPAQRSMPAAPMFQKPRDIPEWLIKKEQGQSAGKKRKRSAEEEAAEELLDLAMDDGPTATKRKLVKLPFMPKKPKSVERGKTFESAKIDALDFGFTAICKYDQNWDHDVYDPGSLRNDVGELWERIEKCADSIWIPNKGEYWQWEFQRPDFKPLTPVCVSQRCLGQRTRWGRERQGYYACKDCVTRKRPCFTYVLKPYTEWVPGNKGHFELLPLHEDDQNKKAPFKKDFEVRYWFDDTKEIELPGDGYINLEQEPSHD